ncbi:MAG: PIN domain-containing protein [Dysgonamonadaceae bacterium]|jgi:predicted nucleic acid-binding protein|nr:PIN domain-containing protein [Dysgonamonadaceae bacterium]
MRIFIDTNILIDLLIKREPSYLCVAKMFDIALKRKDAIVISNLSIINAHYVVKKIAGVQESALRTALHNICTTCEIAPLVVGITEKSLMSGFKDFEDATQFYCALENNCDVIITNNGKDFKLSTLPVMNAKDFLAVYQQKNYD